MKRLSLLFFILLLVPTSLFANSSEIVICRQQSRYFSAGPNQVIRIGDGSVLKAREVKGGVNIVGKKQGKSRLDIGGKTHIVRVVFLPQCQFYKKLKDITKRMLGPAVNIKEHKVNISGHIYRWSDWLNIANNADELTYSVNAKIDEDVRFKAQAHIDQKLNSLGLPKLELNFSPPLSAHLSVEQKENKELTSILRKFGFAVKASKTKLSLKPLVRVKIMVAEVSRSMSRELGLEWGISYSAQLLPKYTPIGDVYLNLKAMEANGSGQILAAPTLLSRSGSKAEFLVGGEFPVKTYGFKSQGVQWKKHGVHLSIQPKADWTGKMSINLTSEVSSIDPTTSVSGIPALKTNRVQTHFDLEKSRTIALSGLIRKDRTLANEQVPFLGSIPILGRLFKSENFLRNQTELVVLVTPEIVRIENEQPALPKGYQNESTTGI